MKLHAGMGNMADIGDMLRKMSRSTSMTSEELVCLEKAIQRLDRQSKRDKTAHGGDNSGYGGDNVEYDGDNNEPNGDTKYTDGEEWRVVAMTIDRMLFIGSMIVFIAGTIGVFARTNYVVWMFILLYLGSVIFSTGTQGTLRGDKIWRNFEGLKKVRRILRSENILNLVIKEFD